MKNRIITNGRPDGVLKNSLDHRTIPVWLAKGRTRGKSTQVDLWVDSDGIPVCAKGNEAPFWTLIIHNSVSVEHEKTVEYPIGLLSK